MADIIHDVIVIGAGVSGLSAAKLLRDSGIENVLVLEARNRVGGRTWTVKNDAVGWVDVGGAYIGRTQNHLLRMIKDLGLKMYPVNEVEKIVLYNGYTGKRYLFASDEMPNVGLFANLDFNNILRLMDKMGEEIPAEAPWAAPNALKWDRMSFAQFIDENMSTKSGKSFMRTFISTCVTSEMHESSLLWFLWYVKQCGGSMPIFSTTGGGQEFKMHGGTNQITEKLAEIVGSDRVKLENAVYSLEQVNEELCIVKTLNGGEYRARHVIMATPPAVQQKIHYNPPLPPMRNQLIQRAPQGTTYKCTLYYERNFWRSKDMCGSMIFYGPDGEFPMTYSLDDSKPDGSHPAIVGFVPADKARLVVKLSREERCHLIAKSFAKAFGIEEAAHPIHYEEQNWSGEQYSGGCYTMTCPPGFLTQYGSYLREPVGRMHFAGTETATEWSGYINGAIQAGERAAREILATMKLIPETEIWQEEPVSKEYPPMPFKRTFYERIAPSPRCLRNTILLTNLGLLVGFCLFKRPETIVGAISKLKFKLF